MHAVGERLGWLAARQATRPGDGHQCVEHEWQFEAVASAELSVAGGGSPVEFVEVATTTVRIGVLARRQAKHEVVQRLGERVTRTATRARRDP